jgi:hypothetical protein
MIQVGLLTLTEKDLLLPIFDVDDNQIGQLWDSDSFFNPVQDGNGDWIISTEEIDGNTNPEFDWVKNLPLITWVPPTYPPL